MTIETRVGKIEDKIGKIGEDQSAIKENLTMMGKTLGTLADVRSETLHLMKQQESDKKDHEEIFARLRKIESGRAACEEKHIVTKTAVKQLESNQRWGVVALLGTIITYAAKKLFW